MLPIITVISEIIVGGYLVVMAIIDLRKKQIPLLPGVLCLGVVATTLLAFDGEILGIGFGIGVGVLLYGISLVSRGSIGRADALVYAVTGAVLGFYRNLELLLVSLLLASLVGGLLLITRHVGRKYRMPFVPFTLAGYGVVIASELIGG